MKKLVLLLLTATGSLAWGQKVTLSPGAEISLITCGPSQDELYTAFGHSALRVYDSANNIDYAYNYGVFDFNQPNFYLNYTRGLLNFKLGVYYYRDFVNSYVYYNRWVDEQVLNITPSQKQALFDYLEWNALPENENYLYDYFYNNCSNRVRDVVADVLKDSLRFDGSFVTTDYTIRQLTDLCTKYQPWGDLGIDICLGLPMDKHATPFDYMFLPDFLEASFDHATVNVSGTWSPLVKKKQHVFVARPAEVPMALIHPWAAGGAFLAFTLILSAIDLRRKKLSRWFDYLVFGATGLIGCLLLVLWLGTNHQAAAKNFNLLWALPSNLLVFLAPRKKSTVFLRKYFLLVAIVDVLLLLSWPILPQQLNIFLVPFVFALLCRSVVVARLH